MLATGSGAQSYDQFAPTIARCGNRTQALGIRSRTYKLHGNCLELGLITGADGSRIAFLHGYQQPLEKALWPLLAYDQTLMDINVHAWLHGGWTYVLVELWQHGEACSQ
ncbi:hypothetical protein VNO77_34446 [Canavalia gladiata]|uniref:Uncharacterized protein n=1 Tax=Canavalia gladiata TaxID=3824 RepID=A0AAN9KHJ4_CANGL